jgi:hypothetical protein
VRSVSADATPPGLATAARSLARASDELVDALEDEHVARKARAALTGAASWANAALEETGNMSALHLIAQLRSTCF